MSRSMYINLFSWIYVHVHIYIYIHIYIYKYLYIFIYIYIYIHMYTYVYMYIYIYTHTCTCVYMHICIHTRHTHTYKKRARECIVDSTDMWVRMSRISRPQNRSKSLDSACRSTRSTHTHSHYTRTIYTGVRTEHDTILKSESVGLIGLSMSRHSFDTHTTHIHST